MQASLGCWFNSGSKAVVFIVANCVIEMENDDHDDGYQVRRLSYHLSYVFPSIAQLVERRTVG